MTTIKRKLLYLTLIGTALLMVQCFPLNAYRILGFDSIELRKGLSNKTDTWDGTEFSLVVASSLKEVNPRYVECFRSLSPVDRCYAYSIHPTAYYQEPDLSTAELKLDKELIFNGTAFAAGSNIISTADDIQFTPQTGEIYIYFVDYQISPSFEIPNGTLTINFSCMVGDEKMQANTVVTVKIDQ
ncbi:MAG: hypothetical protein SOZ00_00990 [Tidjanibacter sp.]|nr:hypothetical protein [Tidjanibacter sp.]